MSSVRHSNSYLLIIVFLNAEFQNKGRLVSLALSVLIFSLIKLLILVPSSFISLNTSLMGVSFWYKR